MKRAVYFMVLVGLGISAYAGEPEEQVQKNSIEVYFPVSHFFDGTETNWTGLVRVGDQRILPVTLGLQYTRRVNEREGLRFSLLVYDNIGYPVNDHRIKITSRLYGLLSAGYIRSISIVDKLLLDFVGELNFRHGEEYVTEEGAGGAFRDQILLRDIGLSAGGRMEYSLPLNFLISGEVKYTRFVYRHSEGVDDFVEDQKVRASAHILTLKLGIGYRF